jgi:hypothetical protein
MRRVYVAAGVFFVLFSAAGRVADTVADAAMKGDIALVRSLLQQKADVNQS